VEVDLEVEWSLGARNVVTVRAAYCVTLLAHRRVSGRSRGERFVIGYFHAKVSRGNPGCAIIVDAIRTGRGYTIGRAESVLSM
jgi:hypothetical protein